MNTSARLASTLLKRSTIGPQQSLALRNMSAMPGRRQVEQFKNWIPSLGVYGAAAFVGLVYFTDWHVVTDYIPFYNGKYAQDD